MGEARFKGDESIEMEFHVISRHFMEVSKTPGRKGRGGGIILCFACRFHPGPVQLKGF